MDVSAALGASYSWALSASGMWSCPGRYAYRGKSRCNADSERQGTCALQGGLRGRRWPQRVDLRLAWTSASDTFGLAACVTNLLR